MAPKRQTYYLLFLLAYVGALVIEKPTYSGYGIISCFSYLFTVLAHFSLFAVMILVNTKLLIPHLLERQQFSLYVTSLIGLVLLYALAAGRYNAFLHDDLFHDERIPTSAGFWDNLVYALCCNVIASLLDITQKWSEQQEQVKNSQINQLQTELKYLRLQLNPHFLFNGLNTVYGLIEMSNRSARDMVVQFSDLLRYNLYEAEVDRIELAKEVDYLQNYVALQKARSNDNVAVSLGVDYQNGGVKIAPLLFMAYVENAFKYVSRGDTFPNRIQIGLREEAGRIDFTCTNTYEEETGAVAGGIGLANAARRLELLYKDRYRLTVTKEATQFDVRLTLTV